MATCKGVCVRYKAKIANRRGVGMGRYASGKKRCQGCEIYIRYEGLYCPCCARKLRTVPRNKKYKAQYKEKMKAKEKMKVSKE